MREMRQGLPGKPGGGPTGADPLSGVRGVHGVHCCLPGGERSATRAATAAFGYTDWTVVVPRAFACRGRLPDCVYLLWSGSAGASHEPLANAHPERRLSLSGSARERRDAPRDVTAVSLSEPNLASRA